ncbi:toxin-antitoxin system HicB family antitoxin [Syntrophus buswellii]
MEFCKEHDRHPEKSFKGSFNIRLTSELHQILV